LAGGVGIVRFAVKEFFATSSIFQASIFGHSSLQKKRLIIANETRDFADVSP